MMRFNNIISVGSLSDSSDDMELGQTPDRPRANRRDRDHQNIHLLTIVIIDQNHQ